MEIFIEVDVIGMLPIRSGKRSGNWVQPQRLGISQNYIPAGYLLFESPSLQL